MAENSTVAVLYPGELGAGFARLLTAQGIRVMTTLASRSPGTIAGSNSAGIVALPTLADVARESKFVFSFVPPTAAKEVAEAYAEHAGLSPADAIYVDANSIGPELKVEIANMVTAAGRAFVDASFNGLAANIATTATLFLSGPQSDEIARLVHGVLRVTSLGPEIGRAATMKMLLGGMSKGLCALFAELAMLAEKRNMLTEFLASAGQIYPGLMLVIDRMLPTYPKHAARRADEMRELQATLELNFEPQVIDAVRRLHEALAAIPFEPTDTSLPALVKRFIDEQLLYPLPTP